MRGTFFGLEIGRNGLTTAQFNLDVTSHNIANVKTEGYTRQRTVQTARDPFATIGRVMPADDALVGGGTRIMVLNQIRSSYLDRRFRTENTQFAYFETRTQSLSYVRSFFNDENTSINQNLADFFRAMTTVSADPVASAPRTALQTSAKDMVQQLNMIHDGLVNLQIVENRAVTQKALEINRIAEQMRDLNISIYRHEATGMIANDLRDQRNLLLDELSTLVDIEFEEVGDPNLDNNMLSMMIVRVAGEVLVNHDMVNTLGIAHVANDIDGGEPIAIPFWQHRLQGVLMDDVDISAIDINDPDFPSEEYLDHLWALFGGNESVETSGPRRWSQLNAAGAALDISRLTGGELKAHIDVRDGVGNGADTTQRGIPYFIEQMNHLARALVQEINDIHRRGWTFHPEGSETNIDFFAIRVEGEDRPVNVVGEWQTRTNPPIPVTRDPDTGNFFITPDPLPDPLPPFDDYGTWGDPLNPADVRYQIPKDDLLKVTARNITLSDEVNRSSFNIAASSVRIQRAGDADSEHLQAGNNENIRAMHELFRSTTIVLFRGEEGHETHVGGFDEFATRIRFDVGNTMNSAEMMADTSRVLTLSADNQRLAVSGVSLDEEMVGLVRFQHAFNGAARVITAMDDALDRIINGMGRVGL